VPCFKFAQNNELPVRQQGRREQNQLSTANKGPFFWFLFARKHLICTCDAPNRGKFKNRITSQAVPVTIKLFRQVYIMAEMERVLDALERLKKAKLIAIVRAKNPDVAIARGIELAEMGCGALEITMDSTDCLKILKALVKAVGHKVLVGVGTVEDKMQIEAVADAGARFALAPVNPYGMVQAAHARGVLAMPAAMTPQVYKKTLADPGHNMLPETITRSCMRRTTKGHCALSCSRPNSGTLVCTFAVIIPIFFSLIDRSSLLSLTVLKGLSKI
jgi:hypothetical protein